MSVIRGRNTNRPLMIGAEGNLEKHFRLAFFSLFSTKIPFLERADQDASNARIPKCVRQKLKKLSPRKGN